MSTRYLFLCPDKTSASGGIAVIHDMVDLLNRLGYEAVLVHNSSRARYPDYAHPVPACYTGRIWRTQWRHTNWRGKLNMLRDHLALRAPRIPKLQLRPTDVVVTPEYLLADSLEAFRGSLFVALVQNPFSLMTSYRLALERGFHPDQDVKHWCCMADVCQRHLELLGLDNIEYFPVSMKPKDFSYRHEKSDLITYMPRKRPWEAKIIDEALRRRGRIGGYELKALDRIPRSEVSEFLSRSRIFISLLKKESLGFPAAEAMAAGCIVVGFDGLGGREFFDHTTGVPVTEGDVAELVEAVERVVAEYGSDPTRLDALRKHASHLVNQRYSIEAFEAGVRAAWERVDSCVRRRGVG